MKEQIENLISKWSDDAEFYMTQQQKSELAERLNKAIGIDPDKVKAAFKSGENEYADKYKNGCWGTKGYKTKRQCLLGAITQSRPLKCEVE